MMPRTHHGAGIASLGLGLLFGLGLGLGGGCMEVPEPLEIEGLYDDEGTPRAAAPFDRSKPRDDAQRDDSTWPRSADPALADLGIREPRTHALWPTPVSEPCPAVMFAPLGPELTGGDVFERVAARVGRIEPPRLVLGPTEVVLLRDHVDLPGVRLVAASSSPGACMMSWRHLHCFVDAHDVYCPDGTRGDLERLVRSHHLEPRSLSEAAWMELVVVLTEVKTLVVDPSLVGECTRDAASAALAPEVLIEDDAVTVRFTEIDGMGDGVDRIVTIERGGAVRMDSRPRWPTHHH